MIYRYIIYYRYIIINNPETHSNIILEVPKNLEMAGS